MCGWGNGSPGNVKPRAGPEWAGRACCRVSLGTWGTPGRRTPAASVVDSGRQFRCQKEVPVCSPLRGKGSVTPSRLVLAPSSAAMTTLQLSHKASCGLLPSQCAHSCQHAAPAPRPRPRPSPSLRRCVRPTRRPKKRIPDQPRGSLPRTSFALPGTQLTGEPSGLRPEDAATEREERKCHPRTAFCSQGRHCNHSFSRSDRRVHSGPRPLSVPGRSAPSARARLQVGLRNVL